MSAKVKQVDNPKLLFLVLTLFAVSVSVISYGLLKAFNPSVPANEKPLTSDLTPTVVPDGSLGDYFKDIPDSGDALKNPYAQSDPFRQTCGFNNGKNPSISFGTVCMK